MVHISKFNKHVNKQICEFGPISHTQRKLILDNIDLKNQTHATKIILILKTSNEENNI